MSIATEIQRIKNAKTSIKKSLENKGVTVGNIRLDEYSNKINEIQSEYNIFLQEDEPTTKDGLWLKTDKRHSKISIQNRDIIDLNWNTEKIIADIPYISDYGIYSTVLVGDSVYIFGGYTSTGSTPNAYNLAYRYDFKTNTYTRLRDIPYKDYGNKALVKGTDVYLIGSEELGDGRYIYKYDTLTDTYTKLYDMGKELVGGGCEIIGNYIYIIGGNLSNKTMKRYDIVNKTMETLANIPFEFRSGRTCVYGTDIYIWGGNWSSANQLLGYKYDTLNNTYTKLTQNPMNIVNGTAISIGKNIYLFGSSVVNNGKSLYKYDTQTQTYTRLNDSPLGTIQIQPIIYNNSVYIFGTFGDNKNKVQVVDIGLIEEFENNELVLINRNLKKYSTIIINDKYFKCNYFFDNVELIQETSIDLIVEKYYGNGTQWIKI